MHHPDDAALSVALSFLFLFEMPLRFGHGRDFDDDEEEEEEDTPPQLPKLGEKFAYRKVRRVKSR